MLLDLLIKLLLTADFGSSLKVARDMSTRSGKIATLDSRMTPSSGSRMAPRYVRAKIRFSANSAAWDHQRSLIFSKLSLFHD